MAHKHEDSEEEQEHSHGNPFADLDEETQKDIQEIQMMEQSFQQILMQKQAFQYESNETNSALDEIKNAEGDIFKIIGSQVIVKTTKDKLNKELAHKKELIDLRLKNIEKQEEEFSKKIESLREKIMKKISNNK